MAMPGLDFVRDDLFGALEEAGELTVRVSMFPTLLEDRSRLADLQAAHTGPLLSARGFKQFFDGVSSQHTAWVHDPYTNARFEGDCGRPTVGCRSDGGARGPGRGRGLARAHPRHRRRGHPPLPRHLRSAPGRLPRPSHHRAFGELPARRHRATSRGRTSSPACSHATSPWIPAARSAIWGPSASLICGPSARCSIPVPRWPSAPTPPLPTSTPSTPSTPPSPAATPIPTSRCGGWLPEERITLAEALRAYTAGSAAAAQRADELGQLAPGMFADIVVLT